MIASVVFSLALPPDLGDQARNKKRGNVLRTFSTSSGDALSLRSGPLDLAGALLPFAVGLTDAFAVGLVEALAVGLAHALVVLLVVGLVIA